MKRNLLQIVNGILGFATVVLAAMTLFLGVDSPVYQGADIPSRTSRPDGIAAE